MKPSPTPAPPPVAWHLWSCLGSWSLGFFVSLLPGWCLWWWRLVRGGRNPGPLSELKPKFGTLTLLGNSDFQEYLL